MYEDNRFTWQPSHLIIPYSETIHMSNPYGMHNYVDLDDVVEIVDTVIIKMMEV